MEGSALGKFLLYMFGLCLLNLAMSLGCYWLTVSTPTVTGLEFATCVAATFFGRKLLGLYWDEVAIGVGVLAVVNLLSAFALSAVHSSAQS